MPLAYGLNKADGKMFLSLILVVVPLISLF